MKDKVVEEVCNDLRKRSEVGIKKYGVTLDRDDLTLKEWIQHFYEENLDAANYAKKVLILLEEEIIVRVRGGCAESDDPRVKIIDYDEDNNEEDL